MNLFGISQWGIAIIAVVILIAFTVVIVATRYKRCPSDRILVVYGRVGADQSARCIHGGGALVIPLIQDSQFISLTPMTINIPLKNALSLQNIRIHVPSTFTVGISTRPEIMQNAAERLLGLPPTQIEDMAREIIFGQLRLTVASLTIEQINQDRESFLTSIRNNVEPELNKIGLYLINVNITDITDESDYINSIGKKAAAEAINRAYIDVADQEKLGAIGQAQASKGREIEVAENVAAAEMGKKKAESDRRVYVHGQEADAVRGENLARARIADSEAELATKEAAAMQQGEIAKLQAMEEINRAKSKTEEERLVASEIVPRDIERRKIEINAAAEAEKRRLEARGAADAILLKYEAEAKGIKQLLDSKAAGYASLVQSCDGDARSAATLLMIEKLEDIVALQVEAVKNLHIDKVTVWDSGGNGDGSSSTSNFISSLVRSIPPLQDIATMAGVELPDYLGRLRQETPAAPPVDNPPA
jgi:flotillin